MPQPPTGTVTFLFTDIEDSTRLWQAHPAAMKSALARHHAILTAAIESHGGYVFQIVGDAFCAAFATAPDALRAALDAQRALRRTRDEPHVPQPSSFEFRVRMGLHTGSAEVNPSEVKAGQYVSNLTLTRVQRLMSAAHGGQVLLSVATAELMRGHLPEGASLRDLGEHRLRGLIHPEHIVQLVAPDLPSEFPPPRTLDTLPNNLPLPLTSFIGREREIEEVKRLLESSRLVTLTGAGGCGKTRLAIQVAGSNDLSRYYDDGVWFVEFASLSDPSLVAQRAAATLEVREQAGQALLTMLTNYLRDKHLLLLLDNCEHLIESCAHLADTLLHTCAHVRLLATSREALNVVGEQVYLVPSLSLPPMSHVPGPMSDVKADVRHGTVDVGHRTLDTSTSLSAGIGHFESVRLFVERAKASQAHFALTDRNTSAVAQICTRLDGIPLAIELAAARVKALSPDQIAARLDDVFRLLTGGNRSILPRHQTLRATMDWSYDLLSEPEQVLFRRLSVFAGGWTLDAAEAVTSEQSTVNSQQSPPFTVHRSLFTDDVLDLLAQLVNKSLVLGEERDGETRYRMLEPIRQYAREKLLESNEVEHLRNRHLEFFRTLAENAFPKLYSRESSVWMDKLESDHDNLRAAIDWSLESGNADAGLRLSLGIAQFWRWRGYVGEGRARLLALLARPETQARTATRARGLSELANYSGFLGMLDAALELSDEAIAIAREVDEPLVVGGALWNKGVFGRDLPMKQKWMEESLAVSRAIGWPFGIGSALGSLGGMALTQGNTQLARNNYQEAVAVLRELGAEGSANYWMVHLGNTYCLLGDYARAQTQLEEALALARKVRGKVALAWSLHRLGLVAVVHGDYASAHSLWRESLQVSREIGFKSDIAIVLRSQSDLARLEGDLATALTLAAESLKIAREMHGPSGEASALASLGQVAMAQGDYAAARSRIEQCLAIRQQRNAKLDIPSAMQLLGDVSFLQGDEAQARSHYEEGLALAREMELKPIISVSLRMLGYLELRAGNAQRAEELFKESFQFNVERKLNIAIAHGLSSFAALALARGQNESAAKLLGATDALLEATHAHLEPVDDAAYQRSLSAARAALAESAFMKAWNEGRALPLEEAVTYALQPESGRAAPTGAPPTYPAGLTAREVEVLRWLTRGLTNEQIAEQLVISPHTVNAHLRSIYGKLDVTTRTAAVRAARDLRLD